MTIDGFVNDPTCRGTCFALMHKSESQAVRYIMAWTDCTRSEAESVVFTLKSSSVYADFLRSVARGMATLHRGEVERQRMQEQLRLKELRKHDLISHFYESKKIDNSVISYLTVISEPQSTESKKKEDTKKKKLYIFDADNHIKEGMSGIDYRDEDDVFIFYATQPGLIVKLKRKNIGEVIPVKSGKQAVDMRILDDLNKILVDKDYESIFVISQDKGFDEPIQKMRCRYKLKKSNLDRIDKFCDEE
ncbi:MAG: hypothetical protein IKR23_11460 [Lachnospiraceae bacterium]|nr:hypothetical protein [Lachnospiraceae bacterium]